MPSLGLDIVRLDLTGVFRHRLTCECLDKPGANRISTSHCNSSREHEHVHIDGVDAVVGRHHDHHRTCTGQ